MRDMSDIQDMLLELDELGITNEQMMKAFLIKDRGTITEWYGGRKPLPKTRLRISRFYNQVMQIKDRTEPTHNELLAACKVLNPEDERRVFIPQWRRNYDIILPQHLIDTNDAVWRKYGTIKCLEMQKASALNSALMWYDPNEVKKSEKTILSDKSFHIHMMANYHPNELLRNRFQNLLADLKVLNGA